MSSKITKNCLKCVHYARQIVYDRGANAEITNIYRVQKCNRLDIQMSGTLSEEKRTNRGNPQFVASICSDGRHFVPKRDISIETVVSREI